MNKKEFIKELENRLSYSEDRCIIINEILENNFFISRKNKDKIITELIEKLNVSNEEADNIYNTAATILKDGIVDSLKHPFRSKD